MNKRQTSSRASRSIRVSRDTGTRLIKTISTTRRVIVVFLRDLTFTVLITFVAPRVRVRRRYSPGGVIYPKNVVTISIIKRYRPCAAPGYATPSAQAPPRGPPIITAPRGTSAAARVHGGTRRVGPTESVAAADIFSRHHNNDIVVGRADNAFFPRRITFPFIRNNYVVFY